MNLTILWLLPFVIIGIAGITFANADISNAIKIFINPPTETRLGGVIAQECPSGEWIIGVDTNGTIICGVP